MASDSDLTPEILAAQKVAEEKAKTIDIVEFLKLTNMIAENDQVGEIAYDNYKSGRVAYCLGFKGMHLRIRIHQRNVEVFNEAINLKQKQDMFYDMIVSIKRQHITALEIEKKKVTIPATATEKERFEFTNDLRIYSNNRFYSIPNLEEEHARSLRTKIWAWCTDTRYNY